MDLQVGVPACEVEVQGQAGVLRAQGDGVGRVREGVDLVEVEGALGEAHILVGAGQEASDPLEVDQIDQEKGQVEEGDLLCEEVRQEAAADLVQVEGGQGVREAQVGQREGEVVLAFLESVAEVHQVQLDQGSGLHQGQVGRESVLYPCREESHCDLLLEDQPSPLLTSVLTVCFFETASQTG